MRPLDDVDRPLGNVGRGWLGDLPQGRQIRRGRTRSDRQLHDAMAQAPPRREFELQLLLSRHRRHCPVDAEHLVVSRNDLPRGARLALVEQDEVLDDVEQPIVRQHAVQHHLGFQAALVRLVEPLPLGEVLPLAGDRAVAGAVAVRHDQEGVVMEGMGDDVLVHVVGEVAVEALADVPVDRLQLDDHQRQAVDEADQVGAAVVVGGADAGELQLADGEEVVRTWSVVEVDHAGPGGLPVSLGVSVLHGHAGADHPVELAVVLHRRAAYVRNCHLLIQFGKYDFSIWKPRKRNAIDCRAGNRDRIHLRAPNGRKKVVVQEAGIYLPAIWPNKSHSSPKTPFETIWYSRVAM